MPDDDATQILLGVGQRHGQILTTRRTQGQATTRIVQGAQLAHLRQQALGDEAAVVGVDQHPAPIAMQP